MSATVLVIIVLVAIVFLYIFLTQRKFVSLEEKMKNAFSHSRAMPLVKVRIRRCS